jgi:hypothetical protein
MQRRRASQGQPPSLRRAGSALLLFLLACSFTASIDGANASTPVVPAAAAPVLSASQRPGRVLACFWGLDRATDVTFLGFQKYVLNTLEADLCAAVTDKHRDGSGAWRDVAKYLDVYEEPRNYDAFVSDVRACCV